nr:hypothetical protein [Sphingomonas sp.]
MTFDGCRRYPKAPSDFLVRPSISDEAQNIALTGSRSATIVCFDLIGLRAGGARWVKQFREPRRKITLAHQSKSDRSEHNAARRCLGHERIDTCSDQVEQQRIVRRTCNDDDFGPRRGRAKRRDPFAGRGSGHGKIDEADIRGACGEPQRLIEVGGGQYFGIRPARPDCER